MFSVKSVAESMSTLKGAEVVRNHFKLKSQGVVSIKITKWKSAVSIKTVWR